MGMRVSDRYVDVLNPHKVEAVIVYRDYDEAADGWGSLYKSHVSYFGPINEGNLNAARSFALSFELREEE